jgi:hypothetical protein
MVLSVFELDDLGIIPFEFETEENFIQRGMRILWVSEHQSRDELIELWPEKIKLVSPRYQKRIKKELAYLKDKYGVDMSWVIIFKMILPWYGRFYGVDGLCRMVDFREKKETTSFAVPIVNVDVTGVIRHELIHAARNFCFCDYARYKSFEEMIAHDRYNNFFSIPILNDVIIREKTGVFKIGKARRILNKYFGKKHGYVFIRLTCKEILDYVLSKNNPYGNPMNYLFEMSKTNLRHWIMCKKLGIL